MVFLKRNHLKAFLLFIGANIAFVAIAAESNHRLLRFVSYSLRDRPPKVSEAKDFYERRKSIENFRDEWLAGDSFTQKRLYRFFNDWFGVGVGTNVINFSHMLLENEEGVLHHRTKGDCTLSEAVDAPAWWLEKGETVKFCPNIIGEQIYFPEDSIHCSFPGGNGILNSKCGCGTMQVLCLPLTLMRHHHRNVKEEFAQRGVYAYEHNQTWDDLFVSDQVVGNRYTYHAYLTTGHTVTQGLALSQAEIDEMMALPLEGIVSAEVPSRNPERSGVVTAPGFMAQFNNFRSRIRAVTERLLCKDVDGSLNTDGISNFLNQSLSDFDRSHGTKEGCAACHYPMDNLGSTLLNWDSNGFFQGWKNLSQEGWSFGQIGIGPQFMMKGYLERAGGFEECVVRRVWEDFSGQPYDELLSENKAEFLALANEGPRALIYGVLSSQTLLDTRKVLDTDQTGNNDDVAEVSISFTEQVQPILHASCSGSSCHSSGTGLGTRYNFFDTSGNIFKNVSISRLQDGTMPPANSGKSISDENMQILIQYISQ